MKIKKVAALALAAVMGASMLAGCASKSIDEDAVVVKMKDGEVRLGVANFMARYTQYTYDSIYGSYFKDDYWSQDMSGKGKTMEEEVKSQVMDSLKTYYALAAHADDYGVKITKEDKKKIEKAAKKFISDNSKDAVTEMSATEEDVEEYLRLVTIQQRMQAKIEEVLNYIPVKHLTLCLPDADNLLNPSAEDEAKQWKTVELGKDMADRIFSV